MNDLPKRLRQLAKDMTEGDPKTASMLILAAKALETHPEERSITGKWRFEAADITKEHPGRLTRFWGRIYDENGRFISHIGESAAFELFMRHTPQKD